MYIALFSLIIDINMQYNIYEQSETAVSSTSVLVLITSTFELQIQST